MQGALKPLALGHPVRWALIREISFDGPLPVKELALRLGVDRPALSSHLPQLLEAGLVEVYPDPNGDARRRCIGLAVTVMKEESEMGVAVDFGNLLMRFEARGE